MAGSSRQAGPDGVPFRVVLPFGPSHESCPFIGLEPHLFIAMGLPALHASRTVTIVSGVRHSCAAAGGWEKGVEGRAVGRSVGRSKESSGWRSGRGPGARPAMPHVKIVINLHHGRVGTRAEALNLLEREEAVRRRLCGE